MARETHTLQSMQAIQAVHGRIQTRADSDGFCQSENLPALHIFSVDEARECLTGRHIVMAGDAALEDTAAGLLDILLNTPISVPVSSATKRQAAIFRSMKKLEDCQNDKFGAESGVPTPVSHLHSLHYHLLLPVQPLRYQHH